MLNHKLLISKGFELNNYPEGEYYELVTTDKDIISKILGIDYMGDEEKLIIQMKKNYNKKIICIDCNIWDLSDKEFQNILELL